MDHIRPASAPLGVLENEIELLRQVEVELDGGALPGAPQGVGDLNVDFGAVKGPAAFIYIEGQAPLLQGKLQGMGGVVPHCQIAYVLVGAGGQGDGVVGETEGVQQLKGQVQHAAHFSLHLIWVAENVGRPPG